MPSLNELVKSKRTTEAQNAVATPQPTGVEQVGAKIDELKAQTPATVQEADKINDQFMEAMKFALFAIIETQNQQAQAIALLSKTNQAIMSAIKGKTQTPPTPPVA